MYTFLIVCAALFLICAIIYKRKMKENQFSVYSIIIIGSLIITTTINGVYGFREPYTKNLIKEKVLKNKYTNLIIYDNDTSLVNLPIRHIYNKDTNDVVTKNAVDIYCVSNYIYAKDADKLEFKLTTDTISTMKVYNSRRDIEVDNKWITRFGLPSKLDSKSYVVYLPDTKSNRNLINILNKNFYKNEEKI